MGVGVGVGGLQAADPLVVLRCGHIYHDACLPRRPFVARGGAECATCTARVRASTSTSTTSCTQADRGHHAAGKGEEGEGGEGALAPLQQVTPT